MSSSSAEARPANRAAGNFILIFLALLLAALSSNMRPGVEARDRHSHPAAARTAGSPGAMRQELQAAPGLLVPREVSPGQARRYHSGFETSDSAGAFGFWILMSLCGLLLLAAAAPRLLQRLRRED